MGGQGGFARAVYPLGKKTALEWHEGRVCETRLGFKDLLMDESMTRHILSKMDGYVYFSTPFYVTDPARGLSAGSSYGRRPDGRMGGTVKGLLEHLIARAPDCVVALVQQRGVC